MRKSIPYKSCLHISLRVIVTLNLLTTVFVGNGQPLPPPPEARPVEVDLSNLQVKTKLPFDAPFVLVMTPTDKLDCLKLVSIREASSSQHNSTHMGGPGVNQDELLPTGGSIEKCRTAPPLDGDYKSEKFGLLYATVNGRYARPNRVYVIKIEGSKDGKLVREFELEAYTDASLSDNIKVDFGVGYAPDAKTTFGLTSVHFYASPINEDTDLAIDNISPTRRFLVRTSFFVGLSPITFSEGTAQPIKNRYKLGNLLYGVGLRSPFYGRILNTGHFGRVFLQPMRLNLGILNFSQANENQAIAKDVNKHTFFVSLTYDLNISTILGPVGKLFQ